MNKVLSFGELLVRIQASAPSFFGENTISAFPGGAEANMAVTLAQMGVPTTYFTAAPPHAMAKEIIKLLSRQGVDTDKMLWQGERIGTYLLLAANGLSSGDVIYDRKYSSFSQLKAEDIEWDHLFEGCSWFHWTALTPALSAEMAELMLVALQEARKRKLYISVDLNYRSRLWQYGKNPTEVMPALVQYCDVVMGNIWAANRMLGTAIDQRFDEHTYPSDYLDYAREIATSIFTDYPQCKHVANTFRFMKHANHNLFYGTYHTRTAHVMSAPMETEEMVDRIGSGDAFMAGLVYGIYHQRAPQDIINGATTAGFDKLFVRGDFKIF